MIKMIVVYYNDFDVLSLITGQHTEDTFYIKGSLSNLKPKS